MYKNSLLNKLLSCYDGYALYSHKMFVVKLDLYSSRVKNVSTFKIAISIFVIGHLNSMTKIYIIMFLIKL